MQWALGSIALEKHLIAIILNCQHGLVGYKPNNVQMIGKSLQYHGRGGLNCLYRPMPPKMNMDKIEATTTKAATSPAPPPRGRSSSYPLL